MEEHLCLRQNPRAGQWEMGEWPGPSESAADGCRSDGVAREISGLKTMFPQDSSKPPFLFQTQHMDGEYSFWQAQTVCDCFYISSFPFTLY
jgi:hypothetical protein